MSNPDGQGPPAPTDTPKPPPLRRRSWLSGLGIVLAAVLATMAVASGLLAARLAQGPLEVEWLRERAASAIEQQLGGRLDVSVGRATVEKSDQGIEVHLRDIRVRTLPGVDLIQSPDSTVVFDTARLLAGSLVPRKLAFMGTEVRVEIGADGQLQLSAAAAAEAGATAGTHQVAGSATDILVRLAELSRGNGLANGLAEIAVQRSRLVVDDRRTGSRTIHNGFELRFRSGDGTVALDATTSRNGRPISLSMEAAGGAAGGSVLRFRLDNLGQDELLAMAGRQEAGVAFEGAVAVSGTLDFSSAQQLEQASLVVEGRNGKLLAKSLDPVPYGFDTLRLAGQWVAGSTAVQLEAALRDGETHLALAGQLLHVPDGWRFTGAGRDLALKPDREQPAVTRISEIDLVVLVSAALSRFEIERLTVRGPEADLSVTAVATLETQGPAMQGAIAARNMPVPALLRFWPGFVAGAAREFFAINMNVGQVLNYEGAANLSPEVLAAAMRMEPLPADSVRFKASVTGAVLQLGHGLPPLSAAVMEATGDAVSTDGRLSRGELRLKSGRVLQLSEGTFRLSALDTRQPQGRFQFRAQGPFDAAVEFAELPEIKAAAGLPFEAADVKGGFDAQIQLAMPLVDKLRLKDVVVEMTASISNGTIGEMFGKDSLDNASLAVRVDQGGLSAKGEGRWTGTPVQIDVRGKAGRPPEAVLQMVLDDQARERRGIKLGRELTGPVAVRITADASPGEGMSARVEADLGRAAIDGILPGFQKPAGRPGRLKLDVQQRKSGYLLTDIQFDAGPTQLRGSAELGPDGDVLSARFQQFRLSPGDNIRLEFDRISPQSGRVVLRGSNFDARPFLKQLNQSGPPGPDNKEIDLNLRSTLLSGFGGEILTNAEVRLKRRGGQVREAVIAGKLGSAAVNIRSEGREDGPLRVILEAADAGALLRFADIYSRMQGGRLIGDLYPNPRGFTAQVNIRDFVLRNEPAIRRLVAEAPEGAAAQVASSAAFTKLRADIVRAGPETTLKEAVIFGPQIGLTLQGTTDAARDRISMSGTFVPAYGLNNAFAQVPLVGTILGGGRNEGLLGLTFSVTGRASQPTVQVNPLSAITPGIFRRIFEFPNDARGAAVPRAEPRDTTRSNAN